MKLRIIGMIVVLCMMAVSASAMEMLDAEEYTDVPSVMTQDAVADIEVFSEKPVEPLRIVLQQPDETSMALLEEVYDFVWRQQNRPVRYYDEETQQKIQALIPDVDIDALHMTEFMAQEMHGQPGEGKEVVIERLLDVDYQPGQLAVVVLGYEMENGEYRWFPYLGEVPELGLIRYTVPEADYSLLHEQDQIIYHVLTTRVGKRGDVLTHSEIITEPNATPSKMAEDIVTIRRWYTENGETIDDLFRIYLVDRSEEMMREIERIGKFLSKENPEAPGSTNPVINWFPEDRVNEAKLLLGDEVNVEEMIVYDVVAAMQEGYKDTYGDVVTENVFTAVYSPECSMVVMLGFPLPEEELAEVEADQLDQVTHFEWYVQRAESVGDVVEIAFKQLVLPRMETEPAMLLVLSEPLEQAE